MSGIIDLVSKSSPVYKFTAVTAGTTIAIWTPRSSAKIYLTGLHINSFGATTGTLAVFFSTSLNTRGNTVGMFTVGTSAYINPEFPGVFGGLDIPLNVFSPLVSLNVTAFGSEAE